MEWNPKPTSSSPLLWDWDTAAATAPEAATNSMDSFALGLGKRACELPAREKGKEVKKAKVAVAAAEGEVRCQVDGCGVDLGGAKEYHRKHRVCEAHSKCPRVVVAGQERRFCQQCSRFHPLSEFDQKKRSCRRRLSDHNARRRKPQPDAFSFGSARLPSSFFDDRRQISFVWNKAPLSHVRPFTSSSWESLSDFKLSQVKEIGEKSINADGINGQVHLAKSQLSNAFPTLCHDIDELLPIKGPESSVTISKLDGAPDLRRALSLLSASSWGLSSPIQQASSLFQFTDANQNSGTLPVSHGGNPTSAFWVDGQPLTPQSQVVQFAMQDSSNAFQELRIKPAYETTLFDTNQIH